MACRKSPPLNIEQSLNAEQVVSHIQNNSTSKQQFSFPKAQRFHCKTELEHHFYAVPSTKTKISAFITTQKRILFQQSQSKMPSPDKYLYSIDGQFYRANKRKSKGCYMALGRSEIKVNNFLGIQHVGPGPLRYYNPQNSSALEKRQFAFTKQKKFLSTKKNDGDSVGPGSYNIDTSLDQHKQILSSQFRSLCPKIIQPRALSRKKRVDTQPPFYCPLVTSKGDMVRINNNKGVKIGLSKRGTLVKTDQNPGPGQQQTQQQYSKLFSQFLSKGKAF